jgi:hypothetical protein
MKKDRSKYCQNLVRVMYYLEDGFSRKLCIYADNSPRHVAFQIWDAYPKIAGKMEPAKVVMAMEQLFAKPEFLKLGKQVVASVTEAFDSRDSLDEAKKRLREAEKATETIGRDYVECFQRAERAQKPLNRFLRALTTGKVPA